MKTNLSPWSQRGFSFVELMIVVAIIGILAAIAIPTYRNYVGAARNSKAQAILMQLPVLMEQYRAESLAGDLCPGGSCNGNVYTEKTGTTEISAFLTTFDPIVLQDGVNYEYKITFTSDTEATLTVALTGNAVDTVTCFFPSGECN